MGGVTEEGSITPKRKREDIDIKEVSIKEYGASKTVYELGNDIYTIIKKHFPKFVDKLFALALLRLTEKVPFKEFAKHMPATIFLKQL